jgi:hypothetical protein
MSGVRLGELGSSDMIDVLHFMFEEDMFTATGEEAEHKSKVRTTLYREFYDKDYGYKISSSEGYASGGDLLPPLDEEYEIKQFDPDSRESPVKTKPKPYVPATNFNPGSALPFGRDIDAPLG